jgi:hypothetical protein
MVFALVDCFAVVFYKFMTKPARLEAGSALSGVLVAVSYWFTTSWLEK